MAPSRGTRNCAVAHVQIEGEIRTREYSEKLPGKKAAEVKKSITEARVVSVTKLDRPAKSVTPAEGAGRVSGPLLWKPWEAI